MNRRRNLQVIQSFVHCSGDRSVKIKAVLSNIFLQTPWKDVKEVPLVRREKKMFGTSFIKHHGNLLINKCTSDVSQSLPIVMNLWQFVFLCLSDYVLGMSPYTISTDSRSHPSPYPETCERQKHKQNKPILAVVWFKGTCPAVGCSFVVKRKKCLQTDNTLYRLFYSHNKRFHRIHSVCL